jgi:hypothetical protein
MESEVASPTASATCQPFALDRGDKAPQGLGHLRAGEVREAPPQRSRSSCVVIASIEGTPILPEWEAVGKYGSSTSFRPR